MRPGYLLLSSVLLLVFQSAGAAQVSDPTKIEIAPEFTTLTRDDSFSVHTEVGLGARLTYNLNKNFALETSGYFFPRRCFGCGSDGRLAELVGGLKAGKRFKSWGVFAKGRPGFVRSSDGASGYVPAANGSLFLFDFQRRSLTSFAADLGGVAEFYPSKRILTRFDAGDTLVHLRKRTTNALGFDSTNGYRLFPFTIPARTTHNFQFSASVGFRF